MLSSLSLLLFSLFLLFYKKINYDIRTVIYFTLK